MCGILGTLNIPFGADALNVLQHRGPDDEGVVNISCGTNAVTLGHRRLSIVDLSAAGRQPMVSHCGNYTIVFNGEIYNHTELRKKINDLPFCGHSDTETIVNYLSRFGMSAVKDFNGIFAFALFSKKENIIYLARDRYGVKPLYYWQHGDKFIFSSEIKAIQKLTDRLTLSVKNLALLLRLRYCPAPYTLFNEVCKVRPGHIVKLDINTKQLSYLHFIEPVSINNKISFNEALERYENYFEEAVKRQLMADVDVGVLLSGGIDSALVTKFAAKHYPKKIKTFTVGFEEESEANELVEAKQTADLIGTEHHEIIISSSQYDNAFEKLIEIIEEPLGTTSTIPLFFLNESVKKYLKVVLTGQGADEPLGGYDRYQGELYYSRVLQFALSGVRSLIGTNITNEKTRRAVYALSEKDIIKRFDKTYALFTEDEIAALVGASHQRSVETIGYYYELLEGNKKHPVESLMSNDLRMNLADDLLLLGDKISMHFSIESRVPLLDNELVDFIESLPYKYRLSFGKGKIIHKKFAERHLPSEIIYRKKKGFNTPAKKWFKEKIGKTYRDLLVADTNSYFSVYFDVNEVKKIFDQHINDGINREKQIFTLISIYYWMKKFIDG